MIKTARADRSTSLFISLTLAVSVVVLAPLSPAAAGNIANFITFNDYPLSTGSLITDGTGESGVNVAADISSGLSSGTGTKGSASLSSNGTEMFFRMRVSADPADGTGGGFVAQQWLVQLATQNAACVPAGSWCNAVSIGVDGKSGTVDQIYIIMADGSRKTIVSSTTGTSPDMSVPGTRVLAASAVDGGTDYLLDWQVSIADINMVLTNGPGCGAGENPCTGGTTSSGTITSTTPIRIFYGTSVSNNVQVINKDHMMGSDVCFSGCAGGDPATVTLSQAKLGLSTSTAEHKSGPNPPEAGTATVYDLTLTATNSGGNPLNNISITDAIPAGVTLVSATSASGTISTSGQNMTWTPANLAIGASATATIKVSVTPTAGQVGNTVTLSSGASGSGVDANTGTATNATSNAVTVGPVAADPTPDPNGGPTAAAQSVGTDEDTPKLITLAGSDPDADPLTYKVTSLPANGTLYKGNSMQAADEILQANLPVTLAGSTVTFVPDANHSGASGNTFGFTVTDEAGSNTTSSAATVTIDVDAVNDGPTWDTGVGVGAAGSLDLRTVSADIETTDANLAYSIVTDGSKGTATITGSTLTYNQSPNKSGTDTVTVRVTDRGDPDNCGPEVTGSCTAASYTDKTVTITLVQTAPQATDQTGSSKVVVDEDDAGELITFAGTDSQSDTLTFKVTSLPSNGKLFLGPSTDPLDEIEVGDLPTTTSSVTFVPTAGYNNGSAAFGPTFAFTASDVQGSDTAVDGTVTIDVDPVNDSPTWEASVDMDEASSLNLKLVSADVETADADLSYSIVTNGTKGTAALSGSTLTYTKTEGQTGTDTVTVRVSDRGDPDDCGTVVAGDCSAISSVDKTVSITLAPAPTPTPTPTPDPTPTNLPPTASVTLDAASPKTNDLAVAAVSTSDPEGDPVSLRFVWKVMRCTIGGDCTGATTTTVRDVTKAAGVTSDSLNLATAGNGDKGEKVIVEVIPNDGTVNGPMDTDMGTVVADTPPTATNRIVRSGVNEAKVIVLEGSDIDGEEVVFSMEQQPVSGALVVANDATKDCFIATGTTPGTMTCHLRATYTPDDDATGTASFSYRVQNTDDESRIATVEVQVSTNHQTGVNQTDEAVQETVQGALVSTGSEPSPDDPTETMIVAPRSGRIEIIEEPVDPTLPVPSGFSFFGQQVRIEVYDANGDPVTVPATEPMRFTFLLDPSIIPAGNTVADLAVYRNGTELSFCTGGPDLVQPTPACVLDRAINSDGFIQVNVLTTAASRWNFAVPVAPSTGAGGGGGGAAPTPTPTPTPPQTTPTPITTPTPNPDPDPTDRPGPRAVLKAHDPTPVRDTRIQLTGRLRDCEGHEGTRLRLIAKIDGRRSFKEVAVRRLDENCRTTYRLKANFKRALFNVIWPRQDNDHRRGSGRPQLVVTHKLPGPLAVLWVNDHQPEAGQLLTMRGRLRRCDGHGGTKIKLIARIDGATEFETIARRTLDARCEAEFHVRADFGHAVFNVIWPKQHHDHRRGHGRPHTVITN